MSYSARLSIITIVSKRRGFKRFIYQMTMAMTKVRMTGHLHNTVYRCFRLRDRFASIAFFFIVAIAGTATAEEPGERKTGAVTGLRLPRFVSLKSDEVNARVGPGVDYAIGWVFKRAGLPVEVLGEFESWRQVRDSGGESGWIAAPLTSNRRTVLVSPWTGNRTLFDLTASRAGGTVTAKVEAGAIVDVVRCDGEFCDVFSGRTEGWISQKALWGVYPGEIVK